jgi:hypothetical protein
MKQTIRPSPSKQDKVNHHLVENCLKRPEGNARHGMRYMNLTVRHLKFMLADGNLNQYEKNVKNLGFLEIISRVRTIEMTLS